MNKPKIHSKKILIHKGSRTTDFEILTKLL